MVVLTTQDVVVTETHHHLVDIVVLLKESVLTVLSNMLEDTVVTDQVGH